MRNIVPCLLCLVLLLGCTDTSYQFDFLEANTPGQSSLRAIYAVDEEVVWTSGSQGLVYLSVNGGEDWSQFSVPGCEDTEFRSLHAWDAKRAMVFDVSPEGRAFMTTDGGTSWEQVYASPTEGAFFNSLKFADNKRGLAISDPIDSRVFILKTEDGGWTWERMESAPESTEGEINFAASNTCIEYLPNGQIYIVTGGNKARVLTSYDHGENWEFRESPMMSGASAGLFSISFSGPKTGVAVGGDFNDPARPGVKAIYTLDGGKNWQEAQSIPAEYRYCVVSLGKGLFFAIGKTGCNYSSDKGKHWIFLDTTGYYAASALGEGNTLFLSGSEGRVAKVLVRRKP